MFDNYFDQIGYLEDSETKDAFGFSKSDAVEKYVRYIGGKDVSVQNGDNFRIEHRFLFQCPFKVKVGDTFIYEGLVINIKEAMPCRDVYGSIIYWEAQGV